MKEENVWKRNKLVVDSITPELSYTVELRTGMIVLQKPKHRVPLTKLEILAVLEELPELMEVYFEDTEAKELRKKLEQVRRAILSDCGKSALSHLKAENAALKTLLREKNQIIKEIQLENRRLRQSDGEGKEGKNP